jgi:hypothetical protein
MLSKISETLADYEDMQQKTPSAKNGVNKRVKGVEPSTKPNNSSGNIAISETGGVKASPLPSLPYPMDEDFLALALAWAKVPEPIRAGISAMVKVATK